MHKNYSLDWEEMAVKVFHQDTYSIWSNTDHFMPVIMMTLLGTAKYHTCTMKRVNMHTVRVAIWYKHKTHEQ